MTSDTMQPEPFPDATASEAPSPAAPADGATPGALVRALLAGAVALLVLLLPGQLAASRDGGDRLIACRSGACTPGVGAVLDERSRRDGIGAREITGRGAC